jgi:hypothetical protein
MAGAVTTSGNRLVRDGKTFVPRGVIFKFPLLPVSLFGITPENDFQADYISDIKMSRDFYYGWGAFAGAGAFPILRDQWNVDTVRLNLFEGALDPENILYSTEYVEDVQRMVSFARSRGFNVIVVLFDAGNKQTDPDVARRPTILYDSAPGQLMATDITARAFAVLVGLFGTDPGVILEPTNEPYCGWDMWLDGGDHNGTEIFGINSLIEIARGLEAVNTIICGGPHQSFVGFPGGVVDSLNRFGYAVHPFFGSGSTIPEWDANFGDLARVAPMLLTAWSTSPKEPVYTLDNMSLPQDFLSYIKPKGIGIVGYAFDAGATIVKGGLGGVPTSWPDQPGKAGGPGELLQSHFLSYRPVGVSQPRVSDIEGSVSPIPLATGYYEVAHVS